MSLFSKSAVFDRRSTYSFSKLFFAMIRTTLDLVKRFSIFFSKQPWLALEVFLPIPLSQNRDFGPFLLGQNSHKTT